jgi:hypothetical protein
MGWLILGGLATFVWWVLWWCEQNGGGWFR